MQQMTKQWILNLLEGSDRAVEKAVLAIYQRQTAFEQSQYAAIQCNGVGFNAADAAVLTAYAKYLSTFGHLNPAHLADARTRIKKYSGQLLQIALAKQAAHDLAELSA